MQFRYVGYDSNSLRKAGVLEADSFSAAYTALNFQGVTVVSLIRKQTGFFKWLADIFIRFRLGERWQPVFFRELSIMLGVMTLRDALRTLQQAAEGDAAGKFLGKFILALDKGRTFSQTLQVYDTIFDGDTIQAVKIGESSGKLQEITRQISERLEKNYLTARKIRGAMYYPLVVLLAATAAAGILINLTLPIFEIFYRDQGSELPLITALLLNGGRFLSEKFFSVILAIFSAIILAIIIYREVYAIKYFLDNLKFRIKIFREMEIRNLFDRLSFLLDSGIPLDKAMKICAQAAENFYMHRILTGMQIALEHGGKLAAVLKRGIKNISPLYIGLIVTGEESGELSEMLRQCEQMSSMEINATLRELPAKAEVYGTLVAGIIVGALVFAIVLPILNMTNLF